MNNTGLWVWNVRLGEPAYWSLEMSRIHGRDPDLGPPSIHEYQSLHSPEEWNEWLKAIATCAQDQSELDFNSRLTLPDGSVKHVRLSGKTVCGAPGEVTEITGVASETGGQRHKLPDPIDLIPAPVWSSGPDGNANFFNRAWLDFTGLTTEEASNWKWVKSFHPDDVGNLLTYWESVMAAGGEAELEARVRRFDGEYRWFLFRAKPVRDQTGKIIKWYGANTDIEDRKRAEEALRSSELNFRLIVETIPALICTMTPQGQVETVNRQVLDYFGKTREELKDWSSIGAVHDDDLERVVAQWRHSTETGEPYDVEHRIRRSDGSYRWFHVRGLPLRDEENRVRRWYVLLIDIDARKRAEEAVAERERELRLLVDSVPGMIATANARGEHEYANKRALDYTGTTVAEMAGIGFIKTIHPEEQEMVKNAWLRSNQFGIPMELDHRWRRFDGEYRWFRVRVHPLRDEQERIVRWYGLLTDIEDQRIAEEALRNSEQHLRLIVETIPAQLWRATPLGRIDYVSRRLVEFTGIPLEDLEQSGWFRSIHPDDVELVTGLWLGSVKASRRFDVSFRLQRADGVYRWFESHAEPQRDESGAVLSWYGLNVDIDDSRGMAEELRQTRARLARASQVATVAELSASIAHEINQPLTAVVANGHACHTWLSSNPPNLERARLTAERVVRNGNDAAQVIQKIRALFKQAPPATVVFEINEMIAETLQLTADEIREGGVIVETDLTTGLPSIVADRVQIQQTLVNLVHNAIEAMDGVKGRAKSLMISSRMDGRNLLIEIRDTAEGTPNLNSIFEPFFTTKPNGMGMGLSICRSIIELHGGRLWATPNRDAGTTFSFTLPVKTDAS